MSASLPRTSTSLSAREPVRMVLYGDSISEVGRAADWHGGASSPQKNWGHLLKMLLESARPGAQLEVIWAGIGGQNTYEGLGRLDWVLEHKPDLLLIEFGANDCGWHPLEPSQTRTAIDRMFDCIRYLSKTDIVVVGPGLDNPLQPKMAHIRETVEVFRESAAAHDAPFVDVRTAMMAATDGGRKWTDFHRGPQDCHPNDAGMAVWAQAAFEVIQAAI